MTTFSRQKQSRACARRGRGQGQGKGKVKARQNKGQAKARHGTEEEARYRRGGKAWGKVGAEGNVEMVEQKGM
jgi:hypothetical protein